MVLMGDVDLPLAAVRAQVESALDLIVQVARRPDGSRRVVEVAEVCQPPDEVGDAERRASARVRQLAGPDCVTALPARRRTSPGPEPDPAWLTS